MENDNADLIIWLTSLGTRRVSHVRKSQHFIIDLISLHPSTSSNGHGNSSTLKVQTIQVTTMKLPYRRPRFIEIHDQFWCPPLIRQQVQTILTFLWLHRIPYFQTSAPFLYATDILQRLVKSIEEEQGSLTPTLSSQRGKLRIVDCCSGGGGPMPRIEWLIK